MLLTHPTHEFSGFSSTRRVTGSTGICRVPWMGSPSMEYAPSPMDGGTPRVACNTYVPYTQLSAKVSLLYKNAAKTYILRFSATVGFILWCPIKGPDCKFPLAPPGDTEVLLDYPPRIRYWLFEFARLQKYSHATSRTRAAQKWVRKQENYTANSADSLIDTITKTRRKKWNATCPGTLTTYVTDSYIPLRIRPYTTQFTSS